MPTSVYKTKDGKRVPSVTTVLGKFKSADGLMHWAWQLGKEGKDYRIERQKAADAGSIAHEMIDAHIHNRQAKLPTPAQLQVTSEAYEKLIKRATRAFSGFLDWLDTVDIEFIETETNLVSNQYRYGGTFDGVAMYRGKRIVADWKSSNNVYDSYIAQVGGYKQLWEENRGTPIEGGLILRVDKEFIEFECYELTAEQVNQGWEAFRGLRATYDLYNSFNKYIKKEKKRREQQMADMSLSAISGGKRTRPLKMVIYGPEGVGKTRFGAFAPKPVFFGAEDGTDTLDVQRFPAPDSFTDIHKAIQTLHGEHEHKTFVIDSLDWLSDLLKQHVCKEHDMSVTDYESYGRGEKIAAKYWAELISALDTLQDKRGMHIILLAHSRVVKFNNPEGEDFDRYQLAMPEKAAEKFKQWAYCLLFMNWENFAKAKESKGKARGVQGERVFCTMREAAYDAKNRYGLPEKIPFDIENPWKAFINALKQTQQQEKKKEEAA